MTPDWVLPVLIALPLLGATLPLFLQRHRKQYVWHSVAAVLAVESILAALLTARVYTEGSILYQIGGSALSRPETFAVGIELLADQITMLLAPLIAGVALAVLIFARHDTSLRSTFYSGYLLLAGGLMGIVLTHDIFNLFVFMEITGIATYALIASNRSGKAAVAAFKYLLIGTVGASLYLIGVGYLYLATGTLNMSDLALVLAGDGFLPDPLYSSTLVRAAFGFMATGLLVKTAIFPLHTWQPDAYTTAPDNVTAYIAALVSTASAYALGRLMFTVYTPDFFAATPIAAELLIGIAAVSIVAGSLLAAMQQQVKRMFAYSSVAQFGMIVAAFGVAAHPVGSSTALVGGIIHLAGHGLLKAGLFLATGIIAARTGARSLTDYTGLADRFPGGIAALTVLGIALIGIPPSIGFVGKWYIALGAVESGIWPIAAVILISTLLTLVYIVRILEKAYFAPYAEEPETMETASDTATFVQPLHAALAVLLTAAVLAVVLGFAGGVLHDALAPFVQEVYVP